MTTIRLAQPQDLDDLTNIITHSFYPPEKSWRWTYPFLKFSIGEDLRHRLSSNSPEYFCFVATIPVLENQIKKELLVGTVEIAIRSQLSLIKSNPVYAYISNLAIHNDYRRQGIARLLLASCEKTALEWGFEQIYLHVLENNDPAQTLYRQQGYRLVKMDSTLFSWLFRRPQRCLLVKSLS